MTPSVFLIQALLTVLVLFDILLTRQLAQRMAADSAQLKKELQLESVKLAFAQEQTTRQMKHIPGDSE